MNILSVSQFAQSDLEHLCARADWYEREVKWHRQVKDAEGRILANLFYEPSTRTSSSFYSAMIRLGGSVVPINNVQYSSVSKGETLEDTIRTMECYSDLIVLRHPEAGAAARAAEVASVPIINAGDGDNEHPTQALLDFYTIQKKHPALDGLHVVMMGDLKRGRTVKSLSKLLGLYDVRISWVSPPALQIDQGYVGPNDRVTCHLDDVLNDADVLYLTRAQKERPGVEGCNPDDLVYGVTAEQIAGAPQDMLLMHPLPRTAELPTSIDNDPRAAYFQQMRNGLYMRMAVIAEVLNDH